MSRFLDLWDRKKDGDRKVQRSFARYVVILTTAMLLFLFLKKDNVFRWIEAGFTIRRQERQIENYRREIQQLDLNSSTLESNRDSLEKFARETYQFAEPGEDVYLIN